MSYLNTNGRNIYIRLHLLAFLTGHFFSSLSIHGHSFQFVFTATTPFLRTFYLIVNINLVAVNSAHCVPAANLGALSNENYLI